MKEQERKEGLVALILICLMALWIVWLNEVTSRKPETPAAVRAAIEASYGEEPKPEGHGR